MNSKATLTRLIALGTSSSGPSQGRTIVPAPNGSSPLPRIVCQ